MLNEVRAKKPIIHCITNLVVANFQANGLLALGASPIMGDEREETADLTSLADALSLNIGTLTQRSLDSMLISGKAANEKRIPVVLDPVGAGASRFRLSAVKRLLDEVDTSLIRCNAGELAAIAGVDWQAKGVDAGEGEADIERLAVQVAQQFQLTVAVTGETDLITDGNKVNLVPHGSPVMANVTGMGCLLSAVSAAFLASASGTTLAAATEALRFYGIAGEKAATLSQAPGSFGIRFLDMLSTMEERDLVEGIETGGMLYERD